MRTYRIKEPSGRVTLIEAKSRSEAISKFLFQTMVPRYFLENHCKVELIGVAEMREMRGEGKK